jgi:transposase
MTQPPVYPPCCPRPTQLTPYLEYLSARWAQGYLNARRLYQELVRRGYRGSEGMVRMVVRPWQMHQERSPQALTPPWVARLILQPARHLSDMDRNTVEECLRAHPLLARGYQLKTRFHTLLAEHDPSALNRWLQEAETSGLPPFRPLARSFHQDYAAIVAALTTPWSTGQCEGQICWVKLITRLGDGRAKLDLLRQRFLHRMPTPILRARTDFQIQHPARRARPFLAPNTWSA